MSIHEDRLRWNRRYSEPGFVPDWAPDVILAERLPNLPAGRALEIASGIGANALFLAKRGYQVDAIDLSDVAIERLRVAASAEGVNESVHLMLGDVNAWPLEAEAYDLVLVFRFLSRPAIPKLHAALKPGGVLLYQTFTTAHRVRHPSLPEAYCASPGELESLFAELDIELYQESEDDHAALATLIGRKRS